MGSRPSRLGGLGIPRRNENATDEVRRLAFDPGPSKTPCRFDRTGQADRLARRVFPVNRRNELRKAETLASSPHLCRLIWFLIRGIKYE